MVNFIINRIFHSQLSMSTYEAFWGTTPRLDWLCTYGCKWWALIPKAIQRKREYKSVQGIFISYFIDSKVYKACTHSILKARDIIFDECNHIKRVTIHATDDDNLLNLWTNEINITTTPLTHTLIWNHMEENGTHPFTPSSPTSTAREQRREGNMEAGMTKLQKRKVRKEMLNMCEIPAL